MIDECTEFAFQYVYDEFLEQNSGWEESKKFIMLERACDFRFTQESFDLIKVPFKALGLICVVDKKRSTTDKQTYWKVTPYDDYIMTKLLVIKK